MSEIFFPLAMLLITIICSSAVGLPDPTTVNLVISRRYLRPFFMMISSAIILVEEGGMAFLLTDE